MYEIYTPKEWTRVFGGCPSIIIDDNGYIYDKDEYYKIMGGVPMGYINYNTGKIYGKDYANFSAVPIGEIKVKEQTVKVSIAASNLLSNIYSIEKIGLNKN